MNKTISTKRVYMLDTNICSFVIRTRPENVIRQFQEISSAGHQLVISAITYSELSFGAIGRKASPKMPGIVAEFVERLDAVLAWDKNAVDYSTSVKKLLEKQGTPIGNNDTLIAGHALAVGAILVTDNINEFQRVKGLQVENWVDR